MHKVISVKVIEDSKNDKTRKVKIGRNTTAGHILKALDVKGRLAINNIFCSPDLAIFELVKSGDTLFVI